MKFRCGTLKLIFVKWSFGLRVHRLSAILKAATVSVQCIPVASIDRSGFLLAGGTDMRLRFWDLNTPNESYVALPAANDVTPPNSLAYELVFIYQTVFENYCFKTKFVMGA